LLVILHDLVHVKCNVIALFLVVINYISKLRSLPASALGSSIDIIGPGFQTDDVAFVVKVLLELDFHSLLEVLTFIVDFHALVDLLDLLLRVIVCQENGTIVLRLLELIEVLLEAKTVSLTLIDAHLVVSHDRAGWVTRLCLVNILSQLLLQFIRQ
jgi:hypothetical protein